ncbi:M20 family metallopeptidase [Vulcanisaeta distributa]|uniref:Probable succinyl-diaminopimelate desuccinylase n=1 Tax=Vulcanisaeta distributa (strain DSM 14429 / JCM 11212 / NBRC 100878 / IC-017) TaxID=572478 RepID=E1QTI7_VULDI|nr:M20 family metallopeptidase [Vulcanisaeta distributa]ADN49702.1 acetylornithine deacetylase or succinyl-diaminopimelate desuccinylase [Vulcanisaeta distributa DSM 14429]
MSQNLKTGLIELTSHLIQIPSVNPPGYTVNIAGFIRDWLGERGFKSEFREYAKDKPNVIARVGRGKPVLILNGHMDVVPPGDDSRWVYPPFSGKIVEGRIYGRGATDMKGGLAVIMMVFTELAPLIERQGSGTLIFSATADEETGGHPGVEALVRDGVLVGDAAIVAEPSGSSRYYIGEKGLCQVKLVTRGRPAHGSLPILGENAIMKLAAAIARAEELINEFNKGIKLPSELTEAIRNSAEVYLEAARASGLNLTLSDFERVVGTVSFNPGVVRGGSKINMVPDYAELELDMRVPPGVSPSQVINHLRSGLSGIADVEVLDTSEPNYTSPGEVIVRIIHEGIERVLGATPRPIIVTGATDGRYLRARGIPTVVYGPGELALAHAYNEYVTVDDLVRTHDVMLYAIRRFFGIPA